MNKHEVNIYIKEDSIIYEAFNKESIDGLIAGIALTRLEELAQCYVNGQRSALAGLPIRESNE